MANDIAPIIIKKKKVTGGDGHHGGAWKVAYADFVTAMMAFFLLMWLLNATTEKQRKGIADYFTPTIAIARVSGGGSGAFGGDSVFTEQTLAQNGAGASANEPTAADRARGAVTAQDGDAEAVDPLSDVEDILLGTGGDALEDTSTMRHIATRLTDEGLVVEVFDLPEAPLFEGDGAEPTRIMVEIAQIVARIFRLVENDIAVAGHTAARPLVASDNPVWDLSAARAQSVRMLLQDSELEDGRFSRIAGHADRAPKMQNPMDIKNNRVEIILLRSDL